MTLNIYIDKGKAIAGLHPETLSDGSTAWNLWLGRNGEPEQVYCTSEKAGEAAIALIAQALEAAVGEKPLVI